MNSVSNHSIVLKNIGKEFKLSNIEKQSISSKLASVIKKVSESGGLVALEKINLEIKHGEMVGIIGRNGNGKSTLLKIMAGIIEPTSGEVIVNGKVAPFLSLGSGFNPELTAKENIILYGMLLGESKDVIRKKIPDILEFAELQDYANVKLKKFSTGMYMRLAFSIAISLDPDIILIDEILAVGDIAFQQKSFEKLMSYKKNGKTIIIVTHVLEQIENLCDRAVLLNEGRIETSGDPKTVVQKYRELLSKQEMK